MRGMLTDLRDVLRGLRTVKGTIAALRPARRAAALDPLAALRAE
jgi:hypothetical protein